jgi:hypothetical protein
LYLEETERFKDKNINNIKKDCVVKIVNKFTQKKPTKGIKYPPNA